MSRAKSLGRILSRGFVAYDSTAVVEGAIVPRLKKLQSAMTDETDWPRTSQIKIFREDIQRLLNNSGQLKILPLFISHADLNHVNILVQEVGEVSGIFDWELSSDLPFGMGCCRIHDLVGRFTGGELRKLEGFEDAEWASGKQSLMVFQRTFDEYWMQTCTPSRRASILGRY